MSIRWFHSTAAMLVFAVAATPLQPARAQDYPSRTVKFVIPYSPGSTLDGVVRTVSRHVQMKTGQPTVVEYKPGGGALVGAQAVLNEPRDGYTLFTPGPTVTTWKIFNKEASIDLRRDFIPVTSFYTVNYMLVTNTAIPAASLAEFIAYAKANSGKLNYGTAGGAMMLNLERLLNVAGVDLVQVPYKAGADMKMGLLNNQVQIILDNDIFHVTQSRAGKERILAVTGRQRTPGIPDVPTVEEAGLRNYFAASWTGVMVGAGTPEAVVGKIYSLVKQAIDSDEYREFLQKSGFGNIPGGQPPAEFAKDIDAEIRLYDEVAARLGLMGK